VRFQGWRAERPWRLARRHSPDDQVADALFVLGQVKKTVAPRPLADSTRTRPPAASTIFLTIGRPTSLRLNVFQPLEHLEDRRVVAGIDADPVVSDPVLNNIPAVAAADLDPRGRPTTSRVPRLRSQRLNVVRSEATSAGSSARTARTNEAESLSWAARVCTADMARRRSRPLRCETIAVT
jgi:hypothetical protein